MAISLAIEGVQLNPSMVLEERFFSTGVRMSVKRTLGEKPFVFSGESISGKSLTLTSGESFGWLTKTTVDALVALANAVGAVYTLQLISGAYSQSYSVIFDHTSGPAVEMSPFVPRVGHEEGDYMFGTIKLLTI